MKLRSNYFSFLFILFILSSEIFCQQYQLDKNIDTNRIKSNLEWLASDQLKGRKSASDYEKMAAEYIASELKQLGAKPFLNDSSYIQKISLEEFTIAPESILQFSEKGKSPEAKLKMYDDYFFMKGYITGKTDILSDAVYAGYGISEPGHDDYQKLNVKGKIVIVLAGMPKDEQVSNDLRSKGIYPDMDYKIKIAEKHDAPGIIIVSDSLNTANWDRMAIRAKRPQQRFAHADKQKEGSFFVILVRPEAFSKHIEPYLSDLNLKIKTSVNLSTVNSYNAIGLLEGTDPILKNEFVVAGAHHDHLGVIDGKIYNGADDNASGVASVLETGRVLKKLHNNKRSVILISHGSEENGLLGSEYFVSRLKEIKNVSAMINIDMVGRESRDTIYPIGSARLGPELKKILEDTNRQTVHFALNYKFDDPLDPDRMYYRSDHYNYAKKGIPVVFFYDYMLKDYHKDTDDVEKIDYQKISKIIQLSCNMILYISNLDHKLSVENHP